MFKKPWKNFGHYQVYLVDEEEIRGLSLSDQEFSNYGIHSDFPTLIPQFEIWLSNRAASEEKFILINEALHRIKYEKQGMSEKQAYNKALRLDKILRKKLFWSHYIDTPTDNKPNKDIYLSKYGTFKNVNVWIVNGTLIRDIYRTDFVEGGHDYVYNWIPRGEIWIDQEIEPEERIFIFIHEFVERELMRIKKLSYNKAHEKAAQLEWRVRCFKKDISTI